MRHALMALLAGSMLVLVGGASGAAQPSGDWTGFGRTTDNMRHSPLVQITKANVGQLGKAYSIDFKALDADTRRGEQSYPLAVGGTLYVTTNDAQVFALEGATGKVLWHYKPANGGLFKNFGIVANRGLAYCDGALFLLTLDMHLNKLSPANGALLGRVAIGASVPGAGSNFGYSETSAPICANHRVIAGAAGSEYGVRGYVMAWNTKDLRPAWPNPVWTIPPAQQSWRSASRIVGGGAVWTPVTVDGATNTLFFGTGSATPLYFPSIRPGTNPRTDSLIAVDLQTGQIKWWRQLIAGNQWSYDVAQPPLVYDGKVGGHRRHVVSVATMEGVWFAFDATTGAPFYERVKVIDRVEHPALRPGKAVTVFPSSLGGLNYSPASYDPATNYVFNAAAETAGVDIQTKLTPTQKKHKFVLGDVFLGLSNGNFGTELAGWHDHRNPNAAASRRPPAGSASQAGATGTCARSIRRPGRSSGSSRPATRSPRARRSSRRTATSTWRSPPAVRRPRRTAASPPSSTSLRSADRRRRTRRRSSTAGSSPQRRRASSRTRARSSGRPRSRRRRPPPGSRRRPHWPSSSGASRVPIRRS
jgi:outer membrane protein assembly factor BamB